MTPLSLNRLTGIANTNSGSFGYGYDALGRRTSLTRPNGVSTSYSYDTLSRLLGVLHNSGSLPGSSGYTYDAAGNRLTKTAVQEATPNPVSVLSQYSYDNIYELTQALVGGTLAESYSYDAVGNRLASAGPTSYNYNTSNELTSTSTATYAYDNNGNTTSKTDSTGTTSYIWDFENRLASVTLPGTGGTGYLAYDPFGRRTRKVFGSATTIYAYDGDNVVEELGGGGNLLAHYTQGAGVDEPLAMTGTGGTYFYHADGLGSTTSMTDSTGNVAASYVYDSFGKQTASTGTLTNPFQYTGRELDSETGLYYYRARHYDPTAGRFLSEDPDKNGSPQSLYLYVDNSPTHLSDPFGMQAESPMLAATWTPQQTAQLTAGWVDALNRLKDSSCRKLFCDKHHKLDPADLLRKTYYELQSLNGAGEAATMTSMLVYIDPTGEFFTSKTTAYIPYDKKDREGMRSVQFDSVADLDAFILLHELGHQVGIFGPDLFGFINGGHSLSVLDACFKKGAKVEE